MAGEIVIPLHLWPHRVNNANAVWDQLVQTTNLHDVAGWRMRDGEAADLNFRLTRPIPSNIHATPAAKIVMHWCTTSTSTTTQVRLAVRCLDVTYNTTSCDPAAWDDQLTVDDLNSGAFLENTCEVSLSSTAVTSGLGIRGILRRDATSGETNDTLASDIIITEAFLVADQAT